MSWRVLDCAGTLKGGYPKKLTEDMGCGNEKTVHKYCLNTPSGCCYLTFCCNNWMPPFGKLIKSRRWFSPCSGGWKVQGHGAKYLTEVIYYMTWLHGGVMSCGAKPSTDAGVGSVLYKMIVMGAPASWSHQILIPTEYLYPNTINI